jgi:hypothetical protein
VTDGDNIIEETDAINLDQKPQGEIKNRQRFDEKGGPDNEGKNDKE